MLQLLAELYWWGQLSWVALHAVSTVSMPTLEPESAAPATPTVDIGLVRSANHVARVRTALLYAPFIVTTLLMRPLVFKLFIMILCYKGLEEYYLILSAASQLRNKRPSTSGKTPAAHSFWPNGGAIIDDDPVLEWAMKLCGVLLCGSALWDSHAIVNQAFGLAFCSLGIFYITLLVVRQQLVEPKQWVTLCLSWFGLMWIPWPLALCLVALGLPHGNVAVMMGLLQGFLGDAVGYYVGKHYGKHKIAPHISPGKSYEGLAAEMPAILSVGLFWYWLSTLQQDWIAFPPTSLFHYMTLSLVVGVVGVYGDAVESWVKRVGGVKDSGDFFPGHGGVLDRMDTFFLMCAPFYTYYVFFVVPSFPAASSGV